MVVSALDSLNINHIEKLITVPLVGVAVLLLPDAYLMTSVVLVVQSHFLLTYIYQYRAGKLSLTPFNMLVYFAIFITAYVISWEFQRAFAIFAPSFFIFHHYFDEMNLAGTQNSPWRTLYFLPILANLIAYTFYADILDLQLRNLCLGFSVLAIAVLLARRDFNIVSVYCCTTSLIFALILYSNFLTPMHIWAFILHSHGVLWYVRMGHKFLHENMQRFRKFVAECATSYVLVIAIGIMSMNFEALSFIYYGFFHPQAYWVWSLMHIIYTIRLKDYINLIPALGKQGRTS